MNTVSTGGHLIPISPFRPPTDPRCFDKISLIIYICIIRVDNSPKSKVGFSLDHFRGAQPRTLARRNVTKNYSKSWAEIRRVSNA